jgi:S-DNA-T family DNA segregation ATPase FtsK/SpoIIIE
VSLRVALRVRDRSDSLDVLDDPAAASLDASKPGRAIVRGATTPLTPFQAARVTVAPGAPTTLTITPTSPPASAPRTRVRFADQLRGTDAPGKALDQQPASAARDLDRIVAATQVAARRLHVPGQPSPWLPPLPDVVHLSHLGIQEGATGDRGLPVGFADLPADQMQTGWYWSVADGHLGIAGSGRSGRTTAVLTIAAQLGQAWSPADVHLYAIGPPELELLGRLPHTAAVAAVDDADAVRLVVERLTAARRERATEPAGPRPRLVLLVDGWERVMSHAHGTIGTEMRALVESSSGTGLRLVVTGGRSILAGPLVPLLAQRLVLALGDPVELALAGIPGKMVPTHQPPGRALDVRTHQQVHLATMGDDAASVITEISRRWTSVGAGTPEEGTTPLSWPRRIRRLPDAVSLRRPGSRARAAPSPPGHASEVMPNADDGRLETVLRDRRLETAAPDRRLETAAPDRRLETVPPDRRLETVPPDGLLAVGVRDGDLEAVGFRPDAGERRVLVLGPPGAGRTTALDTIVESLIVAGFPLALIGSRWTATAAAYGPTTPLPVLAVSGQGDKDRDRLIEARRAHADLAVVVDDVERLAGLPIEPVLLEIARRVDEDRGVVVASTSTIALEGRVGAVAADLARAHTGVILWTSPASAAAFGVAGSALPTASLRIPGRGLLVTPRGVERIQVAILSPPR